MPLGPDNSRGRKPVLRRTNRRYWAWKLQQGKGDGTPPSPYERNQFVMEVNVISGTMTIPCQNVGVFNATINWNDGSGELPVTAYDSPNLTYTGADGLRTVIITGQFPNIYFNNGTEASKVTKVLQLGDVGWRALNLAFFGCSNMEEFTVGQTDTSQVTSMHYMLNGFSNLTITPNLVGLDTSGVTNFNGMMAYWSSITSPPNLTGFDTGNALYMSEMMLDWSSITSPPDLSGFNMAKVTTIAYMIRNWSSISEIQDIGISSWIIPLLTNGINFAAGSTFTTEAYDAVLEAWSQQTVQPNVTIHFGSSKYTNAAARAVLTDPPNNFTITDGGPA